MFFRDYKSKIVKGIEEDDLLEGREKNYLIWGKLGIFLNLLNSSMQGINVFLNI